MGLKEQAHAMWPNLIEDAKAHMAQRDPTAKARAALPTFRIRCDDCGGAVHAEHFTAGDQQRNGGVKAELNCLMCARTVRVWRRGAWRVPPPPRLGTPADKQPSRRPGPRSLGGM